MSRFTPKRLRLAVSQTAVTLSAASRWYHSAWQSEQTVVLPPGEPTEALQSALEALPSEALPRGASLSIGLADPLVRLYLVTPPTNAARFDDLRSSALLRLETLYGSPASNWHIAAAWEVDRPFLACAVPRTLLAVLAQFANARKLRLARITPAALECRNPIQALRSPSTNWLLSKCGTRVTLVVLTRNGVEAVRTLTWPEEAWQSWGKLHAAMTIESMRLDRPLPDLTTCLGDIPAELFANSHPNLSFQHVNAQPGSVFWSPRPLWPEIDLRPASPVRARLTASALVLGGCGVALTIFAGVQCVRLMTQVGEVQNELNHIDRRLAARQRLADTLSATAIKAEQVVAVNGAVRQLNLPWQRLLRNIEEATPKEIALLALEPDAKRASLKGTAEAPTADGMLAYITQLKTQGGFDNAQLTRHEINEQDPMKPFRFQFEAYWSEAGQ